MRFIRWIAGLVVTVGVVAFAVANRQPLNLGFDPLPFSLELPVFAALLGALVVGFLSGLLVEWLLGQKGRRLVRAQRRRIAALEEEMGGLRRRLEERAAAPEDVVMPLPPPGDAA